MKILPLPPTVLNTLLGITKAKKRVKKGIGHHRRHEAVSVVTKHEAAIKRKIGYESEAGRLIRNGLPRPEGVW